MVKITKSLSLGLTTACFSTMLFMSSCSKEDVLTPTPQSDVNQSSNLREAAGGGILAVEYITPTDGPTGFISPNKWMFSITDDPWFSGPEVNATSNLTALAGDPLMKWIKPLPVPSTGAGNIITVLNKPTNTRRAETTINNLVKGKKYKFTYSVSTSRIVNYSSLSTGTTVELISSAPEANILDVTKFENAESQWITKSIEFVAKDTVYRLEFRGLVDNNTVYTNIHVGKNAIKAIN